MNPRLRKLALTVHVIFSVGWLGAVVAYLALAIAGLTSRDAETAEAVYRSMSTIGWFVIVPFSLAALASGLTQSLITEWGLFRFYWVTAKFGLTVIAVVVLLVRADDFFGYSAVEANLPLQLLVHAAGGLLILLTTTSLSVYKPWGRIKSTRLKTLVSSGSVLSFSS